MEVNDQLHVLATYKAVGSDTITETVIKHSILWDITLCIHGVSKYAMPAACSVLVSRMFFNHENLCNKLLADFQDVRWHYIPDDRNFHYLKLLRQLLYYTA
jgi:hypothetical protein